VHQGQILSLECALPLHHRGMFNQSLLFRSFDMTHLHLKNMVLAASLALNLAAGQAHAQSEASLAVSALPVASVMGVAGSVAGGAVALSAVPLALTVSGAVLVVKAVEVSATGTVYVLERASDGARVSVAVAGCGAKAVSAGVGTAVAVGVISAGVVLSVAGEVIAFIPNQLGRALLHNERVTF
jgi:hypothetical protein